MIVEMSEVEKDYPLGNLVVRALKGINLEIHPGEFTAIAGPSGSGKTTLLNLIGSRLRRGGITLSSTIRRPGAHPEQRLAVRRGEVP